MSGGKDKELAGGDVGVGSDGIVRGELVVEGNRTGDGGKGNARVTGK